MKTLDFRRKKVEFLFSALIILVNAGYAISVSGQEFTFTTTHKNITSSKALISRPGLDGNPKAIIIATPVGDTARSNPHPIGAWYYKGMWNLFNTDHAVMSPNLVYKVTVFPERSANQFLHIVTRENVSEGASYIDDPALNGNPDAVVQILQNYAPDDRPPYNLNANTATVTYNAASGKWYIANTNGKQLYPNTAYNVVVDGIRDPSMRPVDGIRDPSVGPLPIPTKTLERHQAPPNTQKLPPTPVSSALASQSGSICTDQMAQQTVGKWAPQKKADVAMADRTFPKTQYKAVLAKAQEAINLFMEATPQFNGIQAWAYSGIRGDSVVPNGPLPFRADIWYGSYICVGNDTYKADMRGKIIVYGNYGFTTVAFNTLSDVLEKVLLSDTGEEIFQYNKDLGELRAWPLIQTSHRDSYHEAVIIAKDDKLPYKPITREQYIRARIKEYESGSGMRDAIVGFNRILENMSQAEREAPALVRDVTTLPGGSRLFASETEGGRHLVTIDKAYFNTKLPRDTIQLITVHWHSNPSEKPKVEMLEAFKRNFDFVSLSEMIGQ